MTAETVTGVLGAATLLGAVAALVATALTEDGPLRRLVRFRAGCAVCASALDKLIAGGDAAWSDQFERPFRHYVRRHGRAPGG